MRKPLSWYWFDLRVRWVELKEKLAWRLAQALPHKIVYLAYIRLHASATSGPFGRDEPDRVTWAEACRRWERREGGDRLFVKRAA